MMTPKSPYSAKPSKGRAFTEKKQVVPNQSLTLRQILTKFVRNEKVSVAHDVSYTESYGHDLEKVANSDLVDKYEFIDKMSEISKLYALQEKKKAIDEEIKKRSAPPATAGGASSDQKPPAGGDGGNTLAQ